MRFLFLLSLFCFHSIIIAQSPDITISETVELPEGYFLGDKLFQLNDGFANLSTKGSTFGLVPGGKKLNTTEGLTLLTFDESLTKTGDYKLKWRGNRRSHAFMSLKNSLLWIYETQKERAEPRSFLVQSISPTGILGEKTTIFSHDAKKQKEYTIEKTSSFNQNKHLLVFHESRFPYIKSKHKTETTDIAFAVLDSSAAIISKATLSIPFPRNQFMLLNTGVDDNGVAYMIGREFPNGRSAWVKKYQTSILKIYSLLPGSKDFKIKTLESNEAYLSCPTLISREGHPPSLFGAFSDTPGPGIKGFFYLQNIINPPTELIEFSKSELDKMSNILNDEQTVTIPFIFHNYISKPDGRTSILLESYVYAINTGSLRREPDGTSVPMHRFKDGLIVDISSTGKVEDLVVIPKLQTTTGIMYSSKDRMNLINYTGTNAVVYNEFPKNYKASKLQTRTWENKSKFISTIGYKDQNGQVVRQQLTPELKELPSYVLPESSIVLKDGSTVFILEQRPSKHDRTYRFGKVKL